MDSADKMYAIAELAEAVGVTPRAIRFYESKGLLNPQRVGRNRVFTRRELARMKLILRGKRLGFSLADIKDYLDLYDADKSQAGQLRLLLDKVDARIAELEAQQRDILSALTELNEIRGQALNALEDAAA
jgi:DNA-binding transcriptional MerR regulator